MSTQSETLTLALRQHQAANLAQAEQLYRQVLQEEPENPNALRLLGVLLFQTGRHDLAVEHLRQALRVQPDLAETHFNLGNALKALGRREEAEASYRRALHLDPRHPHAHNNLGNLFLQQEQWETATACYRASLRCKPDYAEAHNNLGNALQKLGRLEEAEVSLRQALRLQPNFAGAHSNLGIVFLDQEKFAEAVAQFRQALDCTPDFAEGHYNLGIGLAHQGKREEAVTCFREAIHLSPDHAEAHHNLSLCLLVLGEFADGWRESEWRWRCKDWESATPPLPRWDGGPLDGRTVVLWAEQGVGDTIQFVRFASQVKERGGVTLLACRPSLLRLLAGCPGLDGVIDQKAPLPKEALCIPLLSLPGAFDVTFATIPSRTPYLFADAKLLDRWRTELTPYPGFKVGIVWQGNPKHKGDAKRSFPLTHFESLARLSGVRLFSLQHGPARDQLVRLAGRFPVVDLGGRLESEQGDFMDTGAVVKNLDLVVSADTSVAHLAGALGVPVWVAIPHDPDWRWLLHGDDTPWYPTMRLFRQHEPGAWPDVFTRMAAALQQLTGAKTRARPITIAIGPGELLDRITRLEIDGAREQDPARLRRVREQLAGLYTAGERELALPAIAERRSALKQVNQQLRDVEDELRQCEARQEFGPRFLELARMICSRKDRRAELKRQIDELFEDPG